MKRFICILLSTILTLGMLAGCGGKKNDTDDTSTSSAASAPLEAQEDDTMHMNMLFSMIGTPDNGVTELLGDGNHQKYRADGSLFQRDYDGVVYGKDIVFTVSYNEYGDVDEIDVDFDDSVSEQQLIEEISALTGREQNNDGKWTAETAVVSLTKTDNGMCVILTQFSAESAENDVEY